MRSSAWKWYQSTASDQTKTMRRHSKTNHISQKNGNIKNLEKQRCENIKTFKIVWEVIFAKLHAQKKLKMREHAHETKM